MTRAGGFGGIAAYLRAGNGDIFYYAHLRGYAPGHPRPGSKVGVGQKIGTTGTPATPGAGRATSTSSGTRAAEARPTPTPCSQPPARTTCAPAARTDVNIARVDELNITEEVAAIAGLPLEERAEGAGRAGRRARAGAGEHLAPAAGEPRRP